MTFAIESRIKSVARTRVTSNSVFSNPRRVRKTAESLPKVDPSPLVLDCMRIMTISSTDSSIWAACRYGAKGYLLPISVLAGVRLPIIAYAGRTGRWGRAGVTPPTLRARIHAVSRAQASPRIHVAHQRRLEARNVRHH